MKIAASKIPLVVGGVMGGLGLVYFVGSWSGWRVREVSCSLEGGECSKEVKGFLGQFIGRSWLWLDSSEVERAVASNFAVKLSVRKRWGGELVVEVKKKEPVAQVKVKTSGGEKQIWYLTSLDGEVVGVSEEAEALPEMAVEWQLVMSPGESFKDERIMNAVRILAGLARLGRVASGELKEDSFWVEWPSFVASGSTGTLGGSSVGRGLAVVFPLDRDAGVLVAALQVILSQSKIEKRGLVRVDLRYKNPVLTYSR